MNPQTDFLEAVKRGVAMVPAPLTLQCPFCRYNVYPELNFATMRTVYRHPVKEDFELTWEHMTADNFCPNNAKIWILEPDMVTLREI